MPYYRIEPSLKYARIIVVIYCLVKKKYGGNRSRLLVHSSLLKTIKMENVEDIAARHPAPVSWRGGRHEWIY